MTRCLPSILAVLALAATAACNQEAGNDRRTATGEVLEGTISDDMLPLDTIASRAPPAAGESEAGEGEAKPARSADSPSNPAIQEDEPAPAPAAEPAPPAEAPKPGFGE